MSTLNAQIYLNTFSDTCASNAPSLNNVRWCRNLNGLQVANPVSKELVVSAGQSIMFFNQARSLSQDSTTQYTLNVAADGAYELKWVGGTAPGFRTARALSTSNMTTITVTMNGPLMTLTGTNVSFASVVPGDYVTLAGVFSPLNVGTFKVLSASSSSISVENDSGTPEGPIALDSNFASEIFAFGSSGVQMGDSLVISSGFSPLSQQTFNITAVNSTTLEFSYAGVLPTETSVLTQIAVYSAAKRLLYFETDQKLNLLINGSQNIQIQPMINQNSVLPGIYLSTTLAYSCQITNPGLTDANMFVIEVE
jgi:hypothetical protein